MNLSIQDLKPTQTIKSLTEEISKVKSSEEFQSYLDFIKKFYQYSYYNQMLIKFQKPESTLIKGFKGWQKVGRHLKKGEHAIKILAPRFYKKEVQRKDETIIIDGKYFVYVNVFDISQTEGKPIPEYSIDIMETNDSALDLFEILKNYCTLNNIALDFTKMSNSHYGTSFLGKIAINESKNTVNQVSTLIHEIVHEDIHKLKERLECSITQKEYEAEATTYIICQTLNFPNISAKYLALHKEYDTNLSLQVISKTAKKILDFVMKGLNLSFSN